MKIHKSILERRSCRKFIDKPVEKEKINTLIHAAMFAPSACNRQAWKYIVINNKLIKEKLGKYGSPLIKTAPVGIFVLYRNDLSYNSFLYKDHIQSAAAAIENMQLQAAELELGCCWICNLQRPNQIRKILSIPVNFDVVAYVAVGYPDKDMTSLSISHYGTQKDYIVHKRKYNLKQVISHNKFKKVSGDCTELKPKEWNKIVKYIYKMRLFGLYKIENSL